MNGQGMPPFTAVGTKIGRLLASANVDPLAVPRFQREYAWSDDEVEKMLRDFSRAQRANPASPDYFLGSIVMSSGKPLEVIDGQQRLATTAIIFAGIRDALHSRGCNDEAENIHGDYLIRRPLRREAAAYTVLPRLTLNKNDKGFFWQSVIRPNWDEGREEPLPRHDSHFAILAAKNTVKEWFDNELAAAANSADVIDICERWINQLTNHVVVAAITAVNRREAFRMFSTLNARGIQVNQADLVKSHLFEMAASSQAHEHQESFDIIDAAWSSTRTTLDVIAEDGILVDYLRHFLQLAKGLVREESIYEATEDVVTSESSAVQFAENLSSIATQYAAIHSPGHGFWKNGDGVDKSGHRRVLGELVTTLRLKYHRVLLLACCCRFGDRELLKSMEFIRSLSMRLLCCGGMRSGKTETAIANSAKGIFNNTLKTTEDVRAFLADADVVPGDIAFQNALASKRFNTNGEALYALIQIENFLRKDAGDGSGVSDDKTHVDLEHVLPKGKISADNVQNWDHFDPDSKRVYCVRLGNMAIALQRENSKSDQDSFADKRNGVLAKGTFLTNKWFGDNTGPTDKWTESQIEDRQKWLAGFAPKVWPV